MRLWKYQEGCERLIVINQSVWWCNPIKRITLLAAWRALSIPALRNVLALTTRPPSACWWIRPLSGVSEPYDSKPPTHTHTHTHTHKRVITQSADHAVRVTAVTLFSSRWKTHGHFTSTHLNESLLNTVQLFIPHKAGLSKLSPGGPVSCSV